MNNTQKQNTAEMEKGFMAKEYKYAQILERVPTPEERMIVNVASNKRYQGWEKVQITNASGVEKEAIAPVIVSATCRSDIPAWHSDWFMERLRREPVSWFNCQNRVNT